MNSKIDFVILWVDGNDPVWLNEKKKYIPNSDNSENNSDTRFRDWNNLKYWFRAVEENASWVNNIFFITYGHLPNWLDTSNPKLRVVKHSDFIPKEYLPTYNSNVIELNLHRIKGLSENFVLFNDDMFILNKTVEKDFFIKNLPCECYCETVLSSYDMNSIYSHTLFNNMCLINKSFNKKDVYKKNFFKYFNYKYGFNDNLHTLLLAPFKKFSLIDNRHLCVSINKSILFNLWNSFDKEFNNCCLNRFRDFTDVSQYLIRYFQLLSGYFVPRSYKFGKCFELEDDNSNIIKELIKCKYKVICLNDTDIVKDFEKSKSSINEFLETKFSKKSSFEK